MNRGTIIAAGLGLLFARTASAQIVTTEYMYQGAGSSNREFVEFTNVGGVPIDMTNWSFDDDSRTPGSFSLGAVGNVAPGESLIVTEMTAAAFRTEWSLAASVKVIGGNGQNLSRNDEINLYDAASVLVDRLTFGDQNFPGSIRANGVSGWVHTLGLGANNPFEYRLSAVGDVQGSVMSANGDIGSPGRAVVPEPTTCLLLAGAALTAMRRRR